MTRTMRYRVYRAARPSDSSWNIRTGMWNAASAISASPCAPSSSSCSPPSWWTQSSPRARSSLWPWLSRKVERLMPSTPRMTYKTTIQTTTGMTVHSSITQEHLMSGSKTMLSTTRRLASSSVQLANKVSSRTRLELNSPRMVQCASNSSTQSKRKR